MTLTKCAYKIHLRNIYRGSCISIRICPSPSKIVEGVVELSSLALFDVEVGTVRACSITNVATVSYTSKFYW